MLDQLLPAGLFGAFLVFARVGSAVMLLPGFGEAYVSPRLRLAVALVVSLLVLPAVGSALPPLPSAPVALALLLGGEIAVGLLLGTVARLLLTALATAGMAVALQVGIANALANDPASAQQGSIISNFLMALGVLLIFASDLHHPMLRSLVESYGLFVPGAPLAFGDMAELMTGTVSVSFALSMQLAAPFIVIGIVLYLGFGLLARLLPQVQVFFLSLPLQILVGLFLLASALSAAMAWFLDRFAAGIGGSLGAP